MPGQRGNSPLILQANSGFLEATKPGMEHLKEFGCQQGQIDGEEEIGINDQWTVVQ